MGITGMILYFNISRVEVNGKPAMKCNGHTNEIKGTVKAQLVAAKEAILAELARREQDAAEKAAEDKATRQARREALLNGAPFQISYYDGEILSGYTAYDDEDSRLLKEYGVAHEVSGWGTHIDEALIREYGDHFTIHDLIAFTAPAKEAEAAKAHEEAQHEAECLAQAQDTHKPVELFRQTVACTNQAQVECSLDILYTMIRPDGTRFTRRVHTY